MKHYTLSDVHISVPCRPGGGLHPDLVLWLLSQSSLGASISCITMSPIDQCRNAMVDVFLDTGREYLLMVDDDVIPQEDAAVLLRNSGKEIIGGVCYAWKDVGLYPLLLYKHTESTWVPGSRERIAKETHNGIIRVDATGAGCLCVKRDVFLGMEKPYFQTIPGGMGEDIYFCEKARRIGYEIYVHSRVLTDHFVRIGLGGVAQFVAQQVSLALQGA